MKKKEWCSNLQVHKYTPNKASTAKMLKTLLRAYAKCNANRNLKGAGYHDS